MNLLCPDRHDATSYYRAWGPFGELSLSWGNLFLAGDNSVYWDNAVPYHLLFMQRPYSRNHLDLFRISKPAGRPVWVDWDDLLWAVREDNPAYYMYNESLQEPMLHIAEQADLVSVSTSAMKAAFPEEIHPKIQVIPNEVPKRWRDQRVQPILNARPVRFFWRGSATHAGDWYDHLPEVLRFSKDYQEHISWHLMGSPPYFVLEQLREVCGTERVFFLKESPMEHYFSVIINHTPLAHVIFVPLRDSEFNWCKSNIAMLEGVFGGMLPVVPDWHEWRDAPCRYTDGHGVYDALKDAFARVINETFIEDVIALQEKFDMKSKGLVQRKKLIQELCA